MNPAQADGPWTRAGNRPESQDTRGPPADPFGDAALDSNLYAHVFDDLLREKPHVLTPSEEQLLAQAGDMAGAAGDIYTMLANADAIPLRTFLAQTLEVAQRHLDDAILIRVTLK